MIFVKQGDRRPAAPATIKRGTTVVDLTSATSVTFKMRHFYRTDLTVDAAATILSPTAGTVEYQWAPGDTNLAGDYYAEWEVLWSDGTKETFPTIDYDIVHISGDLDGS
jgi:hypothetical protein